MHQSLCHIVFVAMFVFTFAKQKKTETIFWVDVFGNCDNSTSLPLYFNDSGVEAVGKTSLGYGTSIVEHDINYIQKAFVTIELCRSKDSSKGSCEYFQSWRYGDSACSLITTKNFLWTPLFSYNPPLECPFKKGVYLIRNATIDLKANPQFNILSDSYWRLFVRAFSSGKEMFCTVMAGKCSRAKT